MMSYILFNKMLNSFMDLIDCSIRLLCLYRVWYWLLGLPSKCKYLPRLTNSPIGFNSVNLPVICSKSSITVMSGRFAIVMLHAWSGSLHLMIRADNSNDVMLICWSSQNCSGSGSTSKTWMAGVQISQTDWENEDQAEHVESCFSLSVYQQDR